MGSSILKSTSFWPCLSDQEQQSILSIAGFRRYQSGQIISSTETDCLGLLFVQSGILRVYLYSDDGREATIARLSSGECCVLSAACLLSSVDFHSQLAAETNLEVIVLPSIPFSSLMQKNVYIENFVYRTAVEHFSDVIQAVEEMLFSSLEQRICSFLLDETARLRTDTLQLTQEQLAQSIGSARESVTRSLKQLSGQGLIRIFRGGVQILDRKKLYQKASRD